MQLFVRTESSEETESLAHTLGHNLRGGEIIELASDLGGGKTTFVRGLAKGLGSGERVSSPTFTISKVYTARKLQLHHFDFYRLQDPGIVKLELAEVVHDPLNVIAIEWAETVQEVLPHERLIVGLKQIDESTRTIHLTYPKSLSYVTEGIHANADN